MGPEGRVVVGAAGEVDGGREIKSVIGMLESNSSASSVSASRPAPTDAPPHAPSSTTSASAHSVPTARFRTLTSPQSPIAAPARPTTSRSSCAPFSSTSCSTRDWSEVVVSMSVASTSERSGDRTVMSSWEGIAELRRLGVSRGVGEDAMWAAHARGDGAGLRRSKVPCKWLRVGLSRCTSAGARARCRKARKSALHPNRQLPVELVPPTNSPSSWSPQAKVS